MAKKKIDSIEKIENEELVTNKSVTSIISEDKNNIADATSEAKKNIDSIAYADNLVPPNKNSKSIRSLNIQEKKKEKNENEQKVDETNKEINDISKTKTSSPKKNSKNKISENTTKKTQTKKTKNEISKKTVVTSKENNIKDKKVESDNNENDVDESITLNEKVEKKETITDKKESASTIEIEEIKENIINPTKEKNSHKTLFVISFSIITITLLLLIFSTIFALINGNKNTIINGIKIKDIDVSNLTKEQAIEKVTNVLHEKTEKEITLQYKNYEITVFPSQFNVSFNIEDAVNLAYKKGRMRKYF